MQQSHSPKFGRRSDARSLQQMPLQNYGMLHLHFHISAKSALKSTLATGLRIDSHKTLRTTNMICFLCPNQLFHFSDMEKASTAGFSYANVVIQKCTKLEIQENEHGSVTYLLKTFIKHHNVLPSVPDLEIARKLFLMVQQ